MSAITDPPSEASLFSPAWRNISIGSIALCSMLAFEAMGVAAGMPAVAAELGGMGLYALAFAGTLAASVVAMVWAGGDCDRRGPFRSMSGGMLLFGAGLLLSGLSASMPVLVLGRIIQGFGVGSLGVALYVATARAVPAALHPRLFAMFSSAWIVPAVIGPAISGYVVEYVGWRWLFLGVLLLLPPTALLILPALHRCNEPAVVAEWTRGVLRWAWLAAFACVGLALGASAGRAAPIAVACACGVLSLSAARVLPKGTLRLTTGLPTVIAMRGLGASAFFLAEAFVPLWLHQARGWSLTAAGLALTGGALGWSFGSHLQSRVNNEATRESLLARGTALLCCGIAVSMLTVLQLLSDWMLLLGWSIAGLGAGVSLPVLGVLTLKLSPRAEQGTYASALQLSAALCTSTALAAGGFVFSLLHGSNPTLAYAIVFGGALAVATLAWASAPRVFAISDDVRRSHALDRARAAATTPLQPALAEAVPEDALIGDAQVRHSYSAAQGDG